MLVVIFGAGASYDSIDLHRYGLHPNDPWRPPLAKQLFEARPGSFGQSMQRFAAAGPLFMRLQTAINAGSPVEQAIQVMSDELSESEYGARQLAALRFYLQEIIWQAGLQWSPKAFGQTNYVLLVDRIERWRMAAKENVAYVTFNYDLLLEGALRAVLPLDRGFDGYVTARTRLYKAHGSVDWGHPTATEASYGSTDLRYALIDHAATWAPDPNQWFRFMSIGNSRAQEDIPGTWYLHPALALPTAGKAGFEIPGDHLKSLQADIEDMNWLLVIGWRGQEEHMLQLFRAANKPVKAHVVTDSGDTAESLLTMLGTRLPITFGAAFGTGFTGYANSDAFVALVDQSVG